MVNDRATGRLVPLRRIDGETRDLTDEALLAACGTGDPAALGALFDRFHVAVYRFAARLPGTDEHSRDDLVQATFIELPAIAGTFRGTSSVKTWILGVAANVARHQLRGERRRRVRQATYADGLSWVPMRPDEEATRRQLLAGIAQALEALPYDLQVAFILCDLQLQSGVAVASALGVPEGTLWRRLHTARKAIRAALQPGDA